MQRFKITGGAQTPRAVVSDGLATLIVDGEQLVVDVAIAGKYIFLPGDIRTIRPYRYFIGGEGIEIVHHIKDYGGEIIFYTPKFKFAEPLIEQIEATGFFQTSINTIDAGVIEKVRHQQQLHMLPFKPWFIAMLTVVAFILFFYNIGSIVETGILKAFPILISGLLFSGIIITSTIFILASQRFKQSVLYTGQIMKGFTAVVFLLLVILIPIFIVLLFLLIFT